MMLNSLHGFAILVTIGGAFVAKVGFVTSDPLFMLLAAGIVGGAVYLWSAADTINEQVKRR